MNNIFTLVKVFLGAVFLTGCVGADSMYDRYWIGPESRSSDMEVTKNVVIPSRAPSISNSYYRYTGNSIEPPNEHFGIDVIGAKGTPVIAAIGGKVIKVFTEPFYGNNIVIDHGRDSQGRRILTQFKHLESQLVRVGQTVNRGDQIGTLGRTGVLSGGILHVHFELQRETRFGTVLPIDAQQYWLDGPGRVTCFDPAAEIPDRFPVLTYPVVCKDN